MDAFEDMRSLFNNNKRTTHQSDHRLSRKNLATTPAAMNELLMRVKNLEEREERLLQYVFDAQLQQWKHEDSSGAVLTPAMTRRAKIE